MKTSLFSPLLLLVAAVSVVSCGGDDDPMSTINPPPPPPPSSNVTVVSMVNIAFVGPGGTDDITISLGDTVRWVNNEGGVTLHTASSTDVPAGGATFDSGNMSPGEFFEFVPGVVGTWTYLCEVHPTIMVGATITVE